MQWKVLEDPLASLEGKWEKEFYLQTVTNRSSGMAVVLIRRYKGVPSDSWDNSDV